MNDKKTRERIEIPNLSTKLPFPLMDASLATNLTTIALRALRMKVPAHIVGAATGLLFTAYVGCCIIDYAKKKDIKKIDFMKTYGADVKNFESMPEDFRKKEISSLVEKVNDEYTPNFYERKKLAEVVDTHLTDYIANITNQEVVTSTNIRSKSISNIMMPSALGACDPLSGEVYIFKNMGIFEPHIISHEFTHRKGYFKELYAQVLAYLSQIESNDPVLVQSANCERLMRNIGALKFNKEERREFIKKSKIRSEIKKTYVSRQSKSSPEQEKLVKVFENIYDLRMKMTGQNGISDYDAGFTNFLYTTGM